MLEFDEETARQVEAVYMTPDVVEQRRAFRALLVAQPGERVLDIGAGPGLLAAELAQETGTTVHGVDFSESMLAIARRRESGVPLEFRHADAAALPFADESFDAAVSTQVYEYVEDLPAALAEAHRVLRPGGRLLVLDTDWDSIVWHSSDHERMRRVLGAWNEHLAHPYLPRTLARALGDAGFARTDCTVLPILNRGYDRNSFSAGLIGVIAGFVAGRPGVTEAEAAAWAEDLVALGRDAFFSLNRYVFVAFTPERPGS